VIDLRGRTLMPGLIDGHVHVTFVTADLSALAEWSPAYVTAKAARVMKDMLGRGFTTVRDVAGADYGLAAAVEEGYLEGPRLIFGGKSLSQTGGHADFRDKGRYAFHQCGFSPAPGRICDGVDELRLAARDEIRRGAHQLKLMLGGGVASPNTRVDSVQFSLEEIRAVVEEAEAANIYVTGHAYTARAANRGLACGVRCIEHGNLMDESTVALMKEHNAFYVPTLVTESAMADRGRQYGLSEASHRKVLEVLHNGQRALELAHRAGVPIVYGTGLLGEMHDDQLHEFRLRAEVQPPADVVRSATTVAARLLRLEGQVGVVASGASADLLVVDGDPLRDLGVLVDSDCHLRMVMKAGRTYTDRLDD
jgi:imidazolonepropionase-like amidohydrolase